MKKFLNFMGELFYDLTDYAIIIVIMVLVVVVLFTKFNDLLDITVDKDMIQDPIAISDTENDKDDNDDEEFSDTTGDSNNDETDPADKSDETDSTDTSDEIESTDDNQVDDTSEDDSTSENTDEDDTSTISVNVDVKFTIPSGTYPSQIADILIENSLIENKQEFLSRCLELGLDTRLKAGDYIINTSSSLDDIIYALSK